MGLGRLVPATDVVDLFGPSGDQIERMTVTEGHPVARGDVLARLRSYPANQAKKALAQLRLDEAKLREELDIRIQKSRVDRLEVEMAIARNDLEQFLAAHAPKQPVDLDASSALVTLLNDKALQQPEHIQAQLELDNTLVNQKLQVKTEEIEIATLKQEQRLAQERLNIIIASKAEEYASPMTISERKQEVLKLQSELEKANIGLAKLRQNLSIAVQQAKARLRNTISVTMNQRITRYLQARDTYTQAVTELEKLERLLPIEVRKAEQNLQVADHQLQSSLIRAPISGTVLKVLATPGEPTGQTVLFKIGNVDTMYTVAEIYESDALRLRVGQKTTISSVALPQDLHGTVESIGAMIFKNTVSSLDPSALTNSRVVEAWIRLEPNDLARKLVYLQVDVVIHE
ncbi:hypothetical protein C2W62_21185 [Candidatus Entotheonella serta]|nr:hypothetical protein C2W62_21185 [Candidatus Entotheonella serta]